MMMRMTMELLTTVMRFELLVFPPCLSFTCLSSGVEAEAQRQRSGDLLLAEKQTAQTEQPTTAEGTDCFTRGLTALIQLC